ncbi:hypothetical protein NP493_14g07104 [Ridgeia piscesae]|uniref:Uncharacterized protein n=1 Tax=Ridgeia piscesae TaxID=27915 RepID=A0AAD9UL22_RIDPI|nr:hypothetical protein NP493_14g07104 [Ridgeia piscesae]
MLKPGFHTMLITQPGKCSNGPLPPNHDKAWQVEGSPAHKALIKVVLNVRFLKNVHHYVKFRYPVYVARAQLVAIDYQKHKDRPYLLIAAGEMVMADIESVSRRREMMPEDSRRISGSLAPTTPPPTEELTRRHRSRMSRRLRSTQASSPSS